MNRCSRYFIGIYGLLSSLCWAQQTDSVALEVTYNPTTHRMHVIQDFWIIANDSLPYLHINAWANAYKNRYTELSKAKLRQRKDQLYFAEWDKRGWIDSLKFYATNGVELATSREDHEFIKVFKPDILNPINKFRAEYTVVLPKDFITGYGVDNSGDALLNYFFLQVQKKGEDLRHYKDFDAVKARPTHYSLKFNLPDNYTVSSSLKENPDGTLSCHSCQFFELYLHQADSGNTYESYDCDVSFGYPIPDEEKPIIDSLISIQKSFLQSFLGDLNEKVFISTKTKKNYNFFGVDDLDVPILGEIKLFSEQDRIALKLFEQLTATYVKEKLQVDYTSDHWLENGIITYLEIKYIEKYYPDLLLIGNVADEIHLWKIKPLKAFEFSKLEMLDRYKMLNLFMVRQNEDQAITTPYEDLSILNQIAVSQFKTGLSFYYLENYLSQYNPNQIIKNFIEKYEGKVVTGKDFQQYIESKVHENMDWYFNDFITQKEKINFKLVKAKETEDSIQVYIKNKTQFTGPFKLTAYNEGEKVYETWYRSDLKKIKVQIPKVEYNKIVLNDNTLLPEFNSRDNYVEKGGWLPGKKKFKFQFMTDVENPEYNQIFYKPQIKWNNYDKFLLGINLSNKAILPKPFQFSITPRYSTGEAKPTGAGSVSYSFLPLKGLFRKISLGASANYQHYNKGLAYFNWSTGVNFHFNKNPTNLKNRSIFMTFEQVNRDLPLDATPEDIELADYNLYNLGYRYWRPAKIHETKALVNFQLSNKFKKVYGEFYWRWQYSKTKRLGVRVFAGTFLNYDLDNSDFYDFGLDHISDYTFSYPLLGRSETSGIFSQQFVLAEGGFKSNFFLKANEYMATTNVEFPLWRNFDLYADAGVLKNREEKMKFRFDSGIRFKVIPDFLELYLPVQSSMGFEPLKDNYVERIRFVFTFNLGKVISYWRRGRY